METTTYGSAKKEATTLNEILFPVWVEDEELKANPEYSKRVVGIIGSEKWVLNQCSPRYELVPNEKVFPNIENVLNNAGIKFSSSYAHINHARFYADYRLFDDRLAFTMPGTNDKIYPQLNVDHSYNGLVKYKIRLGYYRLVCTNGLVIPVEEMKEFNLEIDGKHTATILKSFETLNEMLNRLTNAQIVLKAITNHFEIMGGKMVVNPADRVEEVLKAVKIPIVDNKKLNTIEAITNIATMEANDKSLGYNGKLNEWLVYNAINQYIHDENRTIAPPDKQRTLDQKVLEYMLETV